MTQGGYHAFTLVHERLYLLQLCVINYVCPG